MDNTEINKSFSDLLKKFKDNVVHSVESVTNSIKALTESIKNTFSDKKTNNVPADDTHISNNKLNNSLSESEKSDEELIDINNNLINLDTNLSEILKSNHEDLLKALTNSLSHDAAPHTISNSKELALVDTPNKDNKSNNQLSTINNSTNLDTLVKDIKSLVAVLSASSSLTIPNKSKKDDDIIDVTAKVIPEVSPVGGNTPSEDKIEKDRKIDKIIDLLSIIADNTGTNNKINKIEPEKKENDDSNFSQLTILGTVLAAGVGAVIGTVKAYINSIKLVVGGLGKLLKTISEFFTPLEKAAITIKEFIISAKDIIKPISETFTNAFEKVKQTVTLIIDGVKTFIGGFLEKGKQLISIFTEASGFNAVKEATKTITKFSEPIAKAIGYVTEIFSGIKSFFVGMVEKAKIFTKVAKAFAGLFEWVLTPLLVVMTLYDVVQGIMKGWDEDGLIGAIKGGLKALLSSLVTVPLDLLKGIISWIMGALGFKEIEKSLDSFSFESLGDWLIDTLGDLLNDITTLLAPLAGPFAIIANLGKSVSKILEGWNEEGIFGALKGGLKALLSVFVTAPLDVLKKLTSWVMGALGFDEVEKSLDSFSFESISDWLVDTLGNLVAKIFDLISPLSIPFNIIANLGKSVSKILEGWDEESIFGVLKGGLKTLSNIFITAPLDLIKNIISWVMGALGFDEVEKSLNSFSFESIGDWLIDTLGDLVAKIFDLISPLAAPFKIFDKLGKIVSELLNNWSEDGLIKAFEEAIQTILSTLISAPLDAIKNAISWIAGAFGFDNVKKMLDDFSFDKVISDLLQDYIFKPLQDIFGYIKDIFDKIKGVFSFFSSDKKDESKSIDTPKSESEKITKKESTGIFDKVKDSFSFFNSDKKDESKSIDTPKSESEKITKKESTGIFDKVKDSFSFFNSDKKDESKSDMLIIKRDNPLALSKNEEVIPTASKDITSPIYKNENVEVNSQITKSDLLDTKMTKLANNLSNLSSNNENLKQSKLESNNASASPMINYAPVTSVQTSNNNIMRIPSRNTDNSILSYFRSRYFSGCHG